MGSLKVTDSTGCKSSSFSLRFEKNIHRGGCNRQVAMSRVVPFVLISSAHLENVIQTNLVRLFDSKDTQSFRFDSIFKLPSIFAIIQDLSYSASKERLTYSLGSMYCFTARLKTLPLHEVSKLRDTVFHWGYATTRSDRESAVDSGDVAKMMCRNKG